MTTMGLNYLQYEEAVRNNKVNNTVSTGGLAESIRHNVVGEGQNTRSIDETIRNNQVNNTLGFGNLGVAKRNVSVNEGQLKVSERNANINAGNLSELNRANLVKEKDNRFSVDTDNLPDYMKAQTSANRLLTNGESRIFDDADLLATQMEAATGKIPYASPAVGALMTFVQNAQIPQIGVNPDPKIMKTRSTSTWQEQLAASAKQGWKPKQ